MARIRSAGNASTELRLVALLRAAGIGGWRRGQRLPLPRQNEEGRVQSAAGSRKGSPQRTRSARSSGGAGKECGLKRRATTDWDRGYRPATVHRLPSTDSVRPDFVFRKERLVVFVDGCFWHGCPRHYARPKARRAFWDAKIAANRARDRRVDRALRASGWRVLHVWEHALASRQIARTLARLRRAVGRPAASVAAFLALRYAAGLVDRER
jgi:DNA mismatch endonuclease (patch repair protein)